MSNTITKSQAAFIESIKSFNTNVTSASNAKKIQKLVAMLSDKKVADLLTSQNVKASDLNVALYTSEKAIAFCYAVTRESADFEANMLASFKTLINAKNANVDVTKKDIHDSFMINAKDVREHVYQRRTKIDSDAQVNYCFAALRLLNVANEINKTTLRVKDCELVKVAETRIKDLIA